MSKARVSDHAIIRHLERKLGFTRGELEDMVADEGTREWAYFVKKGKFVKNETVYVVKDRTIVTTYPVEDLDLG